MISFNEIIYINNLTAAQISCAKETEKTECGRIPNPPWDRLSTISADIASEEKRIRNSGSARSGDFSQAAANAPRIGLAKPFGILRNNFPLCFGEYHLLSTLKQYINYHELMGRLMLSAHRYNEAKYHFDQATNLYEAMFWAGSPPPDLNVGDTSKESEQYRAIIKRLKQAGSKKICTTNLLEYTHGFYHPVSLIQAASSIPQEYVSWAQILISRINIEDIAELRTAESKDLTPGQLDAILENMFKPAKDKLAEAKSERKEFEKYLIKEHDPEKSDASKYTYNFFKERLDRDFELSESRITLGKASLLLRAATRLKLNNRDTAVRAVELAKQNTLTVLNGKLRHNPPETLLNGLATLAWAYSSEANLKEEEVKSSGKEAALKAAIIYKFLLNGKEGLTREEIALIKQDWRNIDSLNGELSASLRFIRRNKENILANGQGNIWWSGTTPDSPRTEIDLDLLGLSGTNELELMLNLAENLKTSMQYDEALEIYNKVLSFKGKRTNPAWIKKDLFIKAQNGKSQILMEQADNTFGRVRAFDQSIIHSKGAIELAEKSLEELIPKLNEIKAIETRSPGDKSKIYMKFKYRTEMLKSATTLAWAYSSLSRYYAELGQIKLSLEAAKKAELINRALRGETVSIGGDTKFNDNCVIIKREFGSLAPDSIEKRELKTELNLTERSMDMGVAEALKLQRKYEEAITEYKIIIDKGYKDAKKYYYKALMGAAECKISLAKLDYEKNGEIEKSKARITEAMADIEKALKPKADEPPKPSETILAQMNLSSAYGTLGFLAIQALNRAEGEQWFDKAAGLVKDIADKIDSNSISKEVLYDAYINKGQTYFIVAEILKAKGEREIETLKTANDYYEKAIAAYEEAIGVQDAELYRLGIIEAKVARAELTASHARLLNWGGDFDGASNLISPEIMQELKDNINALQTRGAPKLIFRANGSLAWLLGLKGGIEEKINGEGAGRELFLKAEKIYKDLLDEKSDADTYMYNDQFLILLDTARVQLLLTRAELLKSAGIRDPRHLKEAIALYRQAKEEFKALLNGGTKHQLAYLLSLSSLNADCGIAEAYMLQGVLAEETQNPALAEQRYHSALMIIIKAVDGIKGKKFDSLNQAKTALRIIKTLTWAIEALGQIKDTTNPHDSDDAREETLTALLIYCALLGKPMPPLLDADEVKQKINKIYPELNLADILGTLIANQNDETGSNITKEEVLFASDTHPWTMRFSHIGGLLSAKAYNEADNEYKSALNEIRRIKVFSAKEYEFLAIIHASMGDANVYKLLNQGEARKAYDRAKIALGRALALKLKKPLPETISQAELTIKNEGARKELESIVFKSLLEVYLRLYNGYGKLLSEEEEFEDSIAEYKKTISDGAFQSFLQNPEVLPRAKLLKIFFPALLSIGDAYNYEIEDFKRARDYYQEALRLIGGVESNMPFKRFKAQAYLGLGNSFNAYEPLKLNNPLTLITSQMEPDYKRAVSYYDLGIACLQNGGELGRDSKKVLAELYAGKARALANLDEAGEAKAYMRIAQRLANEIPDNIYDHDLPKIRKRLNEAEEGIKSKNFDLHLKRNAASNTSASLIIDSRGDGSSNITMGPGFNSRNSLRLYDFSLFGEYNVGIPREINGKPRLSILPPNRLTLGVETKHEWKNFNARASGSFLLNGAPYRLNGTQDHFFWAAYLGLKLGGDAKWQLPDKKTLLMFGGDFELSSRLYGSESPIITMQKLNNKGINDPGKAEIAKKETDDTATYRWYEYLSFAANPYGRIGRRFSIGSTLLDVSGSVGAGLEYTPQATTDNGLWPLDRKSKSGYFRLYGSGESNTQFVWGSEQEYFLQLSTSFKLGIPVQYFQTSASINNVSPLLREPFGLDFLLSLYYSFSVFNEIGKSRNITNTVGISGQF